MAVKSKKVATKEVGTKKASVPEKTAKIVQVEIVPDLMPPEVQLQIVQVEEVIDAVAGMTDAKLVECIRNCATRAASFSQKAIQAGASGLVYAWACGRLMNATKEKLGHGKFGKWREENLVANGISVRTSTRYMLLAARCQDVRGLLQWALTLKQAYVQCGILPDPSTPDEETPKTDESTPEVLENQEAEREKEVLLRKKEMLLTSVSDLQRTLHQGIGIKRDLDRGEIRQLKLARTEIDKFFDQLLGKKS